MNTPSRTFRWDPPNAKQAHRQAKAAHPEFDDDTIKSLATSFSAMSDMMKDAESFLEKVRQKTERDREMAKRMRILEPNVVYTEEDLKNGVRIPDGYELLQSNKGLVKLSEQRAEGYDPQKYVDVFPEMITDVDTKQLTWMYWSDEIRSATGLTLGECCIQYGMGGFHNKQTGVHVKGIYLDDTRTPSVDKMFYIAVFVEGRGQVRAKMQDQDPNVYVVKRTNVPEFLQQIINTRQLINERNDVVHKTNTPAWWYI